MFTERISRLLIVLLKKRDCEEELRWNGWGSRILLPAIMY